jgi:mannose-6-phosphate isomerase-like protein (cupin superfamily)
MIDRLPSGPLTFALDYRFTEGGPVEAASLPFPLDAPAPFEIARWSVAPGTANDLDCHRSREIWLVISGTGVVTFADRTVRIQSGDAIAFESRTSHQVYNDGDQDLQVFSAYWLQDGNASEIDNVRQPDHQKSD